MRVPSPAASASAAARRSTPLARSSPASRSARPRANSRSSRCSDAAVRQPLVRAQGALVMLGGDVEREASGRLVAGLAGVAQRRAGIDEAAGRVEVRGQVGRRDGARRTPPVRAPRPRARAGGRGGRPACRSMMVWRTSACAKREPVEGARRADEPRLLGRLERVERPLGVDAGRRRDDVDVELRARHRGGRQDLGRAGRQAGEPPAHDVADARRDRCLGRVARPRAPAPPRRRRTDCPPSWRERAARATAAARRRSRIAATSGSASGASSSRLTSGRRASPVTTPASSGERLGSESR